MTKYIVGVSDTGKLKQLPHTAAKLAAVIAEAEAELCGFTHADIGAPIVKKWGLPEEIEKAIRYHNNVLRLRDYRASASTQDYPGAYRRDNNFDADISPVTDCVRVANVVARAIGRGIGYEGMGVSVDSNIAERLKLSRENFGQLCAEAAFKVKGVLAIYET